jgi:transcription initiation factor TFIIE subunit alpha
MKISEKIIEEIVKEVAGEEGIILYKSIKNKQNISEFKIAEAIKMDINKTRNILYKLYHANIISFTRKKDKIKGWYIYYWTFQPKNVDHLISQLKKKKLERLKERLDREKDGNFFTCRSNCIRLDFEKAMEFEFRCPECGELMYQEDNTKKVEDITKEIIKLEKETKKKLD